MSRTNKPSVLMPRSKSRLSPFGPVHIAATSAGSLDGICWWYWPFGGLGLFGGCAGALVPCLTGNTRNPIFASATALSRIVMVVLPCSSTALGGGAVLLLSTTLERHVGQPNKLTPVGLG